MSRRADYMSDKASGVGVIDKSMVLLESLAEGPLSLAEIVERTGLARPTAYRLAVAWESHRMIRRDTRGYFALGPRLQQFAAANPGDDIAEIAQPFLAELSQQVDESAQVFIRHGALRRCIAAVDRGAGLRDTVPVGAELTMLAGSAAQVLLAWSNEESPANEIREARFTAVDLRRVRRRGWADSVGQREAGVCSVSAPVLDGDGRVVAAVSVSGPVQRLTENPGPRLSGPVMATAARLSDLLADRG